MFLKEVTHQGYIYLIINTVKILHSIIWLFPISILNLFLWCKAWFSASLLHSWIFYSSKDPEKMCHGLHKKHISNVDRSKIKIINEKSLG